MSLARLMITAVAVEGCSKIVDYLDSYRGRFGVEPICAVLAEAGILQPSAMSVRLRTPPTRRAHDRW